MAAVTKKTGFDLMGSIVSPLFAILLEVFWIFPWFILTRELSIFPWDKPPLNLLSLLTVILVPYLITRFIPARDKFIPWIKLCLILVTIAIVINLEYGAGLVPFSGEWLQYMSELIIDSFSTLTPVIPAFFVSVYLAWRGISLGSTKTFSNDVYRYFLGGLIGTILLIFVWAASLGSDPEKSLISNAGIYIAGFFFFGLSTLAMGNYLSIRRRLSKEKSVPLSNRRWLFLLISIIGGMITIGMAISALFSPEYFTTVKDFFGKIFSFFSYLLEYIYYVLGWIFRLIEIIMTWLISLIRGIDYAIEPAELELGPRDNPPPPGEFGSMAIFKWIIIILVIALVIYLLYKTTKRLTARMADSDVEEFSESLWSWLGFKADISLFFSRLFDRWFGSKLRNFGKKFSFNDQKNNMFADDMNIREIYKNMMTEASESGHRRHSYETPYEYAKRLTTAIPDINEQVDDITDLYVNVRYGESNLKEWETEHANVLWRLIYRFFHRPDKDEETHP